MTWMWEEARAECMASTRACCLLTLLWHVTCHSYRPPRRMIGSRMRLPVESGASMRARSSAKRQSVLFSCHSCPTES
eukprot:5290209-Pleurochrysis_carterae.AAC.1